MKKSVFLSVFMLAMLMMVQPSWAQEPTDSTQTEAAADSAAPEKKEKVEKKAEAPVKDKKAEAKEPTMHQVIKERFVEGGVEFMSIILLCLILGLAIAIERIISLNLSTVNTKKLLNEVENSLNNGGIDAARDTVAKKRGPVAGIMAQGLLRADKGVEAVEKSIVSYGSVEMGKLEKGMSWISLFIALAPMFGFMGTVIGMISAFSSIAASDDISIGEIAGGIQQALLTTVAGLIVAAILQMFYNYCVSKIDSLVNQMEESSNVFVDIMVKYEEKK